MEISVAMCTYNGERYLQEQLDSLASQTYLPSELIICDDHSTDLTARIVEAFSAGSPFPVKFVRNQRNLGSTANFTQAIALCRGDLIALCDQDDIWKQDKLAKQIACFNSDAQLGGVFSNGELIDADSHSINMSLWDAVGFTPRMRKQVLTGFSLLVLARQNFVTGATLMFKASLRPHFRQIPDGWIHDAWITWKICTYSRLALVSDPLVLYRIHSQNQVGVNLQSPTTILRERDLKSAMQLHREELARMVSLIDSFSNATLPGEVTSTRLIQRRIAFIRSRITILERPRFIRAARLLLGAKDYMHFAKGWRSMIGDLLL